MLSNHEGASYNPEGISCPAWPPLRGINKTAWSAKLIPMADLAFPVSCASLGSNADILK